MNFNEIVSVIADHNKRFQETVESLEQDKGRKLTINEIDRLTVDPDTTEYE